MAKVIRLVQAFLRPGLLVLVLIGMTQIVKAQIETEIKCSADKFYNFVKIIKGDGSLGTIRQWQYVTPASSKEMVLKDIVKSVDDENRSITFSVWGGDILTHYKSFGFTLTVTPKDIHNIEQSGSKVKWWIQYEKRTEDVRSPDAHIGLVAAITKELGHYLLQQ
ncbi:hypothetical protein MKW98_020391 [Papaver atlanticum]|uniref:Bet v I/Major latex protein domain-containing protein n=1 Tax=Papaver atlanticum TaxID=357466 RepID=A0AAD4X4G0_9MAGN|nr:hypothetical protein MKW98_020391 [Papaver atlanticum]